MQKYNWTIDDLIDRLKKIEKLKEEEEDLERKNMYDIDIENLNLWINELTIPDVSNTLKLLDNYKIDKENIKENRFLWEEISLFIESAKEFPNLIPVSKTNSLSKKDILDLTHDFYKSALDSMLFHNFLKFFRKRYTHIKFVRGTGIENNLGEAMCIPSLRESFISITRYYEIEDVLSTIHEYSHALSTSLNYMHLLNTTYCEIDSLFMELIAADYLENIFKDGEAILAKTYGYEAQYSIADTLKRKIDIIKAEEHFFPDGFKSNKELKECAKRYCYLENDEVDNLIQNIDYSFNYPISYLFAIELYKLYQEDKDKAIYYLKKIIYLNCKTDLEYYGELKRMGLIPNLHTREFNKEMNENIFKLKIRNGR